MNRLAVHMEGDGPCLGSGFSIASALLAFGRLGAWVAGWVYNRRFHGKQGELGNQSSRPGLSWETEAVA